MNDSLMKGISLLAVIAFTSCSHDAWFQTNDKVKQEADQYSSNFKTIVLGGQDADARQTWNTAVSTQITLTSAKTGTLKIYAADPAQGTVVAALYTSSINKGETKTFTVARPQNATTLFATILDEKNYMIDNMAFDASDSKVTTAFYTATVSARQMKAARRAIPSVFNFTEKAPTPAESDYAESVPSGVTYQGDLTDPWGGNQLYHFVIPNNTLWVDANANSKSGMKYERYTYTVYVCGNIVSTDLYLTANSTLYLTKGSKLTLPGNDYSFGQSNVKIYVANGAELVCNGTLQISNSKLYNNGTVTASKIDIANTGIIYNSAKGMLNINGEIQVSNNNSVLVNDGTITATRLHTAGSSHVQNNATMTISGNTDIDSNNNTWVNNGQYTTGNFYYTAGSNDVINNCRLTVKDLFRIALGDTDKNGFKMDSNSGVVTKYFEADGPSYIFMGAKSVFEVTETATMKITKDLYGIYGPETGDKAVFHAKKIVSGAVENQGFVANYFNQLVVAYDESHFPQGYSDKDAQQQAAGEIGAQPYYRIGEGAIVDKTEFIKYQVEHSECNPGFNGGNGNKVEPKQYVYFAFEDLGTSDDFDFNDVVVRVSVPDANNMSTVELCAIGGTLQQKVFCGDTQIGEEVHSYGEFGANTKTVVGVPIAVMGTVNVPAGTSVADLNISIQVVRRDGQIVTIGGPQPGETPFRVVVTGDEQGKWFWAKERTNISDAYNLFGKWGVDMDSNPDWYKHPVNSKIVKW